MNKKLPSNYAQTGALIDSDQLQKRLQQAFTATEFHALISISGIDANTGEIFNTDLHFTKDDPEFMALINDYGARLAGIKIAETFMPVTNLAPKEGMEIIGVTKSNSIMRGYRYSGYWYNMAGELVAPDEMPIEYKIYVP